MLPYDPAVMLLGVAGRRPGRVSLGPADARVERDRSVLFVALEELVAGLAGDAEGAADVSHRLAFEEAATKRRRSSMTELTFHGIDTSPGQTQEKVSPISPERNVTYVSERTDRHSTVAIGLVATAVRG